MKKFLLALMLLAPPAAADAVRYVNATSGNDAYNGMSAIHTGSGVGPWKTITKANAALPTANADSGDVTLYVGYSSSQYSGFPNPAGTPADGKRYRIIGVPRASDGARPAIAGGTVTKTYVTLQHLRFNGNFDFASTARQDSLVDCTMEGNLNLSGKYNVALRINGNGNRVSFWHPSRSNVLSHSTFYDMKPQGAIAFEVRGSPGATCDSTATVDSIVVERNRFKISAVSTADYKHRAMYYMRRATFKNNYWEHTQPFDNSGDENDVIFVLRDMGLFNAFVSDTIIGTTPGTYSIWLSGGGNECPDPRVAYCRFDSLYIALPGDLAGPNYLSGGPIFQYPMWSDTMRYCTILTTSAPAIQINPSVGWRGHPVFDHNTFASGWSGPVVDFTYGGTTPPGGDSLVFTNNIVAHLAPGGVAGSCSGPAGVSFPETTMMRTVSDWNLYSVWSYQNEKNDRSIRFYSGGGTCYLSAPGDSANGGELDDFYDGRDVRSIAGSAFLRDSVPCFDVPGSCPKLFSAEIGYFSFARGKGKDSTDIGARAYVHQAVYSPETEVVVLSASFSSASSDSGAVVVTNTGSDSLHISSVTASSPHITLASFSSLVIAPGATATLSIVVDSRSADHVQYVTFVTDDPFNPAPSITVICTGCGIAGPGGPGG